MPLRDRTNPTPQPKRIEDGEQVIRATVSRMEVTLTRQLNVIKRQVQNFGRANLATQLNSTNAGDAAELLDVYQKAKTLLDAINAANDLGDLPE